MNRRGKSDRLVVPKKPANNGRGAPRLAELVEERSLAKGNSGEHNRSRTQCRQNLKNVLDRVRQAAAKDRKQKFTCIPILGTACAFDPR